MVYSLLHLFKLRNKMGPVETVLKYLSDQNRPYSANDVFMNLHREIGKTAVQKALDQLAEQGKVVSKVYNKQKVYVVKQEDSGNNEDLQKELTALDSEINGLTTRLKEVENDLRASEQLLRELQVMPTTEEAKKKRGDLEIKVQSLRDRLKKLSENTIKVPPEEKEKVQKDYQNSLKEWKKRKSLCMDMVNAILEGYPKSKKIFLEEVGIETDEEAGVSMK